MSRFSSIFSQLLQLFPRLEFHKMVKEKKQKVMHAGLPVRDSLWPCSSANWAVPIHFVMCHRFPM